MQQDSQDIKIYSPDDRLSTGFLSACRALLSEVWRLRYQVKVSFMRDFKASYLGTRLGVFWNIALPLFPVAIYIVLAATRVVPQFEQLNPMVAIALNATLWFFFVGCVRTPMSIVKTRNAEAMKTSLPLSVAICASFGRLSFDTVVRFSLLLILAIMTLSIPAYTAPLSILALLSAVCFFFGLGLFFAILSTAMPDLERIVDVVLNYGIFVSGVIFPLAAFGPLAFLDWANPFAVFIAATRQLIFGGGLSHPMAFACFAVFSWLFLIFAMRLFYVMEKRIRSSL